MIKLKLKLSVASFALLVTGLTNAGIIEPVKTDEKCLTTSVQITSITAVAPAGENIVPTNTSINSTSCLGFITDPGNDWGNNPNPNMGGLGDGLLNGQDNSPGNSGKDGYYVPGDTFLTNVKDSMVNLDGLGEDNDPGWIRLGGADTKTDNEWNFNYDSIGDYNLGSVIDMSFSDNGAWSLEVDPSAIELATLALGRPSIFDHLAFVLKGPNSGGDDDGSWAIYDFNFYDLIDDGWDISLGDTAYKFEGTWDTDLFINDDALSHMSVWAHDPPAGTTTTTFDIPEPSTIIIFTVGMIGLASRKINKHC
jgi:hypothetical protein